LDQASVDQMIRDLQEDIDQAEGEGDRGRAVDALAIAEAKRAAIVAPTY
jgi:hypothetical protein